MPTHFPHIPLGRLAYQDAFARQVAEHERILASRDQPSEDDASPWGVILSVEHPPVITISRRAGAATHLLASHDLLASQGIALEQTDRGGDITYHGPGQLVLYPIIDLNKLGLGLHDYMRLLEQSVIDACATWGVVGERDATATGVWVRPLNHPHPVPAKIAAFGVRVRRWITMHGLALNVHTNLAHFAYIVPCGLHGRPVTSLQKELGTTCPTMEQARDMLVAELSALLDARYQQRSQTQAQPREATS